MGECFANEISNNMDEIGVSKIPTFSYTVLLALLHPPCNSSLAHGQTFHPPLPIGWRFGGPPSAIPLCLLIQPTTRRHR